MLNGIGRLRLLPVMALGLLACGQPDPLGPSASADQALCSGNPSGFDFAFGTVNWGSARSGNYTFGINEISDGLNYPNSNFATNWSAARGSGVIRGVYQYFEPLQSASSQAAMVVNKVGKLGTGDLPVTLDLETGSPSVPEVQSWLDTVQAGTGKKPMIYTSPGFWNGSPLAGSFTSYPLWVANWGTPCPPALPTGFSSYVIWQNGNSATVGGVNTDTDVFNGTPEALHQFAGSVSSTLNQLSGNAAMTFVNWPDHHAELYALGTNGTEYHAWADAGSDVWNSPQALGLDAGCGSSAAFWAGPWDYPELFSPTPAGQAEHLWWNGSSWTPYQLLDTSSGTEMSTVVWMDGIVEAFLKGNGGAVWHDYWDLNAGGGWTGWASLGGSVGHGPTAIVRGDGQTELFMVDTSGQVQVQVASSATAWTTSWTGIGGNMTSRVAPVRWDDGHISAFARGNDGLVYIDSLNGSTWSGWTPVDGTTLTQGEPSAIINPGGYGPEVFTRASTGQVIHAWWNGSSFSAFTALGSLVSASDPFAWIRGDGSGEAFAIDGQGNLERSLRTSGTWAAWSSIGSGFEACAAPIHVPDGGVARSDGGNPEVDAGSPDAGATDAGAPDGGSYGPVTGCQTSPAPLGLGLVLLMALWLLRRRTA